MRRWACGKICRGPWTRFSGLGGGIESREKAGIPRDTWYLFDTVQQGKHGKERAYNRVNKREYAARVYTRYKDCFSCSAETPSTAVEVFLQGGCGQRPCFPSLAHELAGGNAESNAISIYYITGTQAHAMLTESSQVNQLAPTSRHQAQQLLEHRSTLCNHPRYNPRHQRTEEDDLRSA